MAFRWRYWLVCISIAAPPVRWRSRGTHQGHGWVLNGTPWRHTLVRAVLTLRCWFGFLRLPFFHAARVLDNAQRVATLLCA